MACKYRRDFEGNYKINMAKSPNGEMIYYMVRGGD